MNKDMYLYTYIHTHTQTVRSTIPLTPMKVKHLVYTNENISKT